MKKTILLLVLGSGMMLARGQTETLGALKFEEEIFDFGTLKQGADCVHEFKFTNTGTMPIIVSEAYTNTGAAIAEFPKEPVQPGKSGVVRYKYDSNRIGPFNKSFTLKGNFLPVTLTVKGLVEIWKGPVITFEETTHNFGEIIQGDPCMYEYKFTNTGTEPLIISNVNTNTGAAVATYPKAPIKPGESGIIKYYFDTKSRTGSFEKTLTIQANIENGHLVLRAKGTINPKPEEIGAPLKTNE